MIDLALDIAREIRMFPKYMKLLTRTLSLGSGIFFKDMVRVLVDYFTKIKLTRSAMIDNALLAFNKIMAMETFSLLDDGKQSSTRNDLGLHEMYKTRLLRVDLEPRSRVDPFQRQICKYLRAFRYWRLSRTLQDNIEAPGSFPANHKRLYQNTILLASALSRLVAVVITGSFLVVPLAMLSQEQSRSLQLTVVSVFILAFDFLVATLLKVSNLELMVVSAAYAAVLSVFVSNFTT
jgi:hypothetical protein